MTGLTIPIGRCQTGFYVMNIISVGRIYHLSRTIIYNEPLYTNWNLKYEKQSDTIPGGLLYMRHNIICCLPQKC